MSEEQPFVLANSDSAIDAPGAFVLAPGALRAEDRITERLRPGARLGWHEHDERPVRRLRAPLRPAYTTNLIPARIPALKRVEAKRSADARVADIGRGLGSSPVLLTQAYPNSTVTGSDYHAGSIELAARRAADAGSRAG